MNMFLKEFWSQIYVFFFLNLCYTHYVHTVLSK